MKVLRVGICRNVCVPAENRTRNRSLGNRCYIHLTTGTDRSKAPERPIEYKRESDGDAKREIPGARILSFGSVGPISVWRCRPHAAGDREGFARGWAWDFL